MKNLLRRSGLLLGGLLFSGIFSIAANAAIESNAVNLPANNKVLFLMGQDTTTLRAYKTDVLTNPVHSTLPKPGGVTLYVSVLPKATHPNSAPANATMYVSGIEGPPVDNNNGEVNFAETLGDYDLLANNNKVALAVGLYLSDEWANCSNQPLRAIAGTGDADVGSATDSASLSYQWRYAMDRMINYFKASGRPVYLRIGYEFDGPWNCYNQTFYKSAYRWIATRIDQLGATNVATVWQAATYPDDGDATYGYQVSPNPAAHYEAWYPGDAYVDWIGISFFAGSNYLTYQWSCQDGSKPWTVPDTSPRILQNALMTFARNHSKPAMIAESAPQAFDLRNLHYSCTAARQNQQNFASGQAAWNAFFTDYFQWIYDNRDHLRAVAYINTDWQSQSRWYCAPGAASCAAGYWGITSLQANSQVMSNFKTEMAKTFYAHAGSPIGGGNSSTSSVASSAPSSVASSTASSVAVVPPAAAPQPTASAGNASVSLSWNAIANATSYRINYGFATGALNSTQTTSGTSATVSGLSNGYAYDFTVTAINSAGEKTSARVTATPVGVSSSSRSSSISSSAASSAASACGDFGIAYSNNNTMVLYHKNNGWSASWNYLCLNSDCRAGTLSNGYYRRSVSGVLGQSYSIEFKVQQAAAPGQYMTGQQTKTFTNQCVLP
ncbi:family 31 carbohydrate-binding protein [Cellvibrio sp. NN19]|uniref:family 31 carbohydrate-binding protein n=1 Tax=Cellvibrio chitinivorans TaxID=3102792 RepID=UPI002B411FAF|nr:family 31 carbohydrate-binding protein [Cellvibrio sp. NN19]